MTLSFNRTFQMDSRLILVVIGVIALAFKGSEAIICYRCWNQTAGSNCQDPFNSTGVEAMSCTDSSACYKMWLTEADVTTFDRSCYTPAIEADECESASLNGRTGEICLCKSDLCNDGQMVKPTSYNVIIGVAMATVTAIARMNQS